MVVSAGVRQRPVGASLSAVHWAVRTGAARTEGPTLMMHQHGSLMAPLLGDVFCQCRSAENHPGVDPGGGDSHADDRSSASSTPVSRQPAAGDRLPDLGQSEHPCDICGGPEQEHRLKVLFQVLDVNGDGGICVNDLTIGLKKLGVHRTEHELMVRGRISALSYEVMCFCPCLVLYFQFLSHFI